MPKLSIITPAFIDSQDRLNWFGETLDSVLTQGFTDWESIIIDDCSPTDLAGLKREFSDPRFRWFRTSQNSGPALCRNTAAALAESGALLPIDADDILADENALAVLYDAWQSDKFRIVYGDLQRLENGERGKIYNLPEYTFNKALDTNGIMPVTALHSVECHVKAGGWKPELNYGLEDVEYWIAAGKAGFCGQKTHGVVLLYRRHETSRHARLKTERHETEMRNKIVDMHRDVYEGRFPMGCCGGGGSSYVPPSNQSQQMS
ncbi:MAG: glycosyltransferase family 2 protein, partial [Nitrospiria bacterium]